VTGRERQSNDDPPVILAPNRNCWRIERAERAAVLIDAACYFGALRKALIKARSTVFVVGWDIDSRTRLVGESGRADDGYPETFIDLLSALAVPAATAPVSAHQARSATLPLHRLRHGRGHR
jgi:hypothetical protein